MINDNTFRTSKGEDLSPAEVIKRYRTQMLVHSYLYYWLGDPIWSDDKWQQVADDLAELQRMFPEPIQFFDDAFKDWNGSTGMHLPNNGDVAIWATNVHRLHQEQTH